MKKVILFITVILTAIIAACFCFSNGEIMPLSLEVLIGENRESIHLHSCDDEWYAFLPGYVRMENVYFRLTGDGHITVNGTGIHDGMKCDLFETDVTYEFRYSSGRKMHDTRLTFLCSQNVSSMHIDTSTVDIEYIHSRKGNEDTGAVRLYTANGQMNYCGNIASIKGRGNATWDNFDKKPYSMELTNEADLLGMGESSRWILIANAADPALIRNKLAFDFARALSLDYIPQSQWIDLYINNAYMGLYLLCERNEIDDQRVDISAEDGVLVSMEREDRLKAQNYPYVKTESGTALRIHTSMSLNLASIMQIQEKFQHVEDVILSSDENKSLAGTIDLDSWVKKYLIEEIFLSCDACCISQYFYYEGNGKVYAGPVWDFDYSLGNQTSWQCSNSDGLYAKRSKATNMLDTPWFHALYENDEFYDRMRQIYSESCVDLIDEMIAEGIREEADFIAKAAYLNNVRWGVPVSENHNAQIVEFLSERREFLSDVWVEENEYHQVRLDAGFGEFFGYYSVPDGGYMSEVPIMDAMYDHQFEGWFYEDTDEPFDITKSIHQDTNLYAAWVKTATADQLLEKASVLIPMVAIAGMGAALLLCNLSRMRKGG